jgi:hypothetical protein
MPTDWSGSKLYQIHHQRHVVPAMDGVKDPLEAALRKFLIEMSLLPQSEPDERINLFEVLKQGIFLSPAQHRLALSVQFKRLLPQRVGMALQSRAPNHDLTLRRFAACGGCFAFASPTFPRVGQIT